jgi:GAF domain
MANHECKLSFQDARFNKEVDKQTGYMTKNILSMPILDFEGEVIGVAQIVNKLSDDGQGFTADDEQVRPWLSNKQAR